MDEDQVGYAEGIESVAKLSHTEQMLRSVLIVGCALGVILGLAFASLLTP